MFKATCLMKFLGSWWLMASNGILTSLKIGKKLSFEVIHVFFKQRACCRSAAALAFSWDARVWPWSWGWQSGISAVVSWHLDFHKCWYYISIDHTNSYNVCICIYIYMYFYSCRCWIHVWWIGLGIEFIFNLYLMYLTYLTCTFVRGDIYGLSFAKTLTSTWDALQKASSIKPSTTIQKSDHEGNFIISCGNDEESDEGIAEYITLQAKPGLLNT